MRLFKLVLFTILIFVLTVPGSTLAQDGGSKEPGRVQQEEGLPSEAEVVPGRIIVKYREGVSPAARSDARRKEGLEKQEELGLIGAEMYKVADQPVEQTIRNLQSLPEVEYAEPDYVVRTTFSYTEEPRFEELWGLHNTGQTAGSTLGGTEDVDVNAVEASAVTLGDPNLTVGVLDDGVDFSHPDLAGREWKNPGESGGGKETNGIDDDGNGYVDDVNGWDFCYEDNTVHDSQDYHGTHVAGTVAASLNGEGVVGVAPAIKIMALKFLGPNGGSTSDAILAIQYAKSKGVKILNNSWGGESYSRALEDAIEASGALFVASAGNDGLDTDKIPHYPSSFTSSNILSVGAINNQGEVAGFSNYGVESVDLSAPGVQVLSSIPGAWWEFFSGTSVAAPYATGAAALVASDSPDLLSDVSAIKEILMDSGKPVPAAVGKTATAKMVDARATLPPRIVVASPKPGVRNVSPGANATATFSEAMSPATINAGTFTLTKKGSSVQVDALVSYDAGAKKATLNPNAKLKRGAIYTARVTTGAKDLAGLSLDQDSVTPGSQPKTWSFRVKR